MTIFFQNYVCILEQSEYRENGRIALSLVDKITSEPVAIATVNMVDVELLDKEIIIKDYSENEGIYDALVAAGVISKSKRQISTGWVTFKICDYLL